MSGNKSATRELYEKLAASPQRRRTIAENIFRQLRNAGSSSSSGFSADGATRYTAMIRTRTAD